MSNFSIRIRRLVSAASVGNKMKQCQGNTAGGIMAFAY